DYKVTGVQTCALPIFRQAVAADAAQQSGGRIGTVPAPAVDEDRRRAVDAAAHAFHEIAPHLGREAMLLEIAAEAPPVQPDLISEIGRASCRERVKSAE